MPITGWLKDLGRSLKWVVVISIDAWTIAAVGATGGRPCYYV
jgi:hypothetical protein